MRSAASVITALLTLLLGACGTQLSGSEALAALSKEPLDTEPWYFGQQPATLIKTQNYRIFTTINDGLYQRLVARLLEAVHDRALRANPQGRIQASLDCYVFAGRSQWEAYTRARTGSNASVYLQIEAGGYCLEGVFAGYDIGRQQTFSVIAHEAWHQYSWFAFKDRLPSWLEEGLATQNEAIDWNGTTPIFRPAANWPRFRALKDAQRENRLFRLSDLLTTHAGRMLALPQKQVDAYYAQIWSLTLFLQHTPPYAERVKALLADANAGHLTSTLAGTSLSRAEIDNYTERWNAVAGPIYMRTYIASDLPMFERQYLAWIKQLTASWPPDMPND